MKMVDEAQKTKPRMGPVPKDFPRISYVYGKGSCPVAEDLASRVLTLPTYYGLPLEDVRAIAGNVVEIVASC